MIDEPITLPEKFFSGFRSDRKARIYEFYKYLQGVQKTKYWNYSIATDELKQLLGYEYDTDKMISELREVAKKAVKTEGYFVVRYIKKKRRVMFISYK